MSEELIKAIAEVDDEQAVSLAQELLADGANASSILDDCRAGMAIVGKRFEAGEYFISELILAGEMLKAISAEVKPHLSKGEAAARKGKILLGTVKGDIHDIAKDIVGFMLDINGYDVRDMGIDVPVETVVSEIKTFQPQVVALSGFLTLAYTSMKETVDGIKAAGLRDRVKIMIGGGTIDEKVCEFAGADGWGIDAMKAVELANQWCK